MSRPGGRKAALGVFVGVLVLALPAGADPANPTNYESEVTDIQPPEAGLDARVVGGDTFLSIEVEPGVEAEVPGYEGEPYIRIGEDGEVEANRNSPSFWVNEDRYGRTPVPSGASVEAPPDWETVGGGGSYGWHDHRIHWMSPDPPPVVERSSRSLVQEWTVPLTVDGRQVEVNGVLEWIPAVSPVPWAALSLAAGALVAWLGSVRVALAVGASLATLVGLAQALASPLGLAQEALAWAPPVVALVLLLLPVGSATTRRMLAAVAAVVLVVWVGVRLSSLWMPTLPSPLPEVLERSILAVAAGVVIGVGINLYRRVEGARFRTSAPG